MAATNPTALRFDVAYPDRQLDRLSSALRIVTLELPEPDTARLSRELPLVKWLLALPHYIVRALLYVGVVIAVVLAWFTILFTGRYPLGLYDFVVGVGRWHLRVIAYAFALVTDDYAPFRLGP